MKYYVNGMSVYSFRNRFERQLNGEVGYDNGNITIRVIFSSKTNGEMRQKLIC